MQGGRANRLDYDKPAALRFAPTIAQKLMRHSTIQLTLETYTKSTTDETTDAVNKLA
jgi:hypothetical protein